VRPVGESREETVDVRILSANAQESGRPGCGKDASAKTCSNRINVIELRVPSLRERSEDIPAISDTILGRLGKRMNIDAPQVSEDAHRLLRDYPVSRQRPGAGKHPGGAR